MARKKDGSDSGLFFVMAGLALLASSVFLINTCFVMRHFSSKYDIKNAGHRVTDTGNILRFALPMMTWVLLPLTFGFLGMMIIGGAAAQSGSVLVSVILSVMIISIPIIIITGLLATTARLGTTQIGMLVFPEKGVFVIPADPAKNTFTENILKGRYLFSMFTMEELPLKEVDKITREKGNTAFIHGKFGTRGIKWRNKQKRDECIAALERACKKRLSSFDAGE